MPYQLSSTIVASFPANRRAVVSPAAVAGLRPGDVLVKINDASLGIALAVTDALADKEPGDTVNLTYRRDGAESQVSVQLTPSPVEDTQAA